MTVRDTYAWASPYGNADPEKLSHGHWRDLYGKQLWKAQEFAEHCARTGESPEIFLLGNFSPDRRAFVAFCREHGINFAYWEDGFFPHYSTQHLDPLGFCWESSLPGMLFRGCSDRQRKRAHVTRAAWLARSAGELPPGVQKPFVVWPLQLIGDQVNRHDLNVPDWTGLLRDFRARLPATFQLVLKPHPLSRPMDVNGLDVLMAELPDILMVPHGSHLTTLLRECHAVAGANSSVLYEARLMHHKPAYAYSRSWFTNHPELVIPVSRIPSPGGAFELPRPEWLENPELLRTEFLDDYTDWFLAQLLARQIDRRQFTEAARHREAVWRLSNQSYREHGEAIFDL